MPISRAGNREAQRGLSLIELVVALTIVSLIAALAAPEFNGAIDKVRLAATARTLVNSLKQARALAVSEQREVTLTLDVTQGSALLPARLIDLEAPSGTTFELVTARSEQLGPARGRIRFFPDGSSTGGSVRIANDRTLHVINVDWITGRVTLTQ